MVVIVSMHQGTSWLPMSVEKKSLNLTSRNYLQELPIFSEKGWVKLTKFAFKKMVLISVHQDLARISRKASGRTDGDQVLRRPGLGVGGECRHFRRLRDQLLQSLH
ncbi:hypothetical protein BHE74_00012250 [Ensete ventricosum]|nr:hypothetical protein BHE74_00012250 [Ensete ventricosum]